jgi:hypothetical protein
MTVSELLTKIVFIGSVLGAFGVIMAAFTAAMNYLLKPIKTELRKNDVRQCRIFLVGFLCDVENGVDKDEVQWKLAHEIYDHYEKDLKENSYVHDKWERVVLHGNNE